MRKQLNCRIVTESSEYLHGITRAGSPSANAARKRLTEYRVRTLRFLATLER